MVETIIETKAEGANAGSHTIIRVAIAVASAALAALLTVLFREYIQHAVFVFFFAAIVASAWYNGLAGGIITAAISTIFAWYFLLTSTGTFITNSRDAIALVIFVTVSALIITVSEKQRIARARAEHHAAENERLALRLEEQSIELEQQAAELEIQLEESHALSEQLRAAHEQLEDRTRELLADAERIGHHGSWEWDVSRNRVTWSDEMHRIYGYEPGALDITYETFLSHVHPEDVGVVQTRISEAYATGSGFQFRHRIVRADGTTRLLDARGRIERDANGAIVRMVGTGQDITEVAGAKDLQRQLEREAQLRAEAETANRAKFEFLTTMSHELRTPLNAIAGYTELLTLELHGPVSSAQRTALERIQRNQKHLLGIINDILNFAKLDTGHVNFNVTAVAVRKLFDDIEALIQPQVMQRSLTLRTDIDDADCTVLADEEKTLQILLNLLSNAIKFTASGGSISVHCATHGDIVQIDVKDTGEGIPEDRLEAIFDPFVQVNMSYTRTREGTGLGLSIARDLARAMGGQIRVQSKLGEGSTFQLTLPRAVQTTL